MKHLIAVLVLLLSAISAEAQSAKYAEAATEAPDRNVVVRPRFFDNWSMAFAGGLYHPNFYELKYLLDCSGYAGSVEVRKQLTPTIGLGIDATGYLAMDRSERKDPRSVVGPMLHVNLMNLFGGYRGRSRIFELEVGIMPAWGHLYRGSVYDFIPDENYFATKYSLDFNFNLGRSRAWTLSLKPALILDVTSKAPTPGNITQVYDGYRWKRSDVLLFAGFAYRFRGHNGAHNFTFARPSVNSDEVERLNEIVRYLREDVDARDREIRQLKSENKALREAEKRVSEPQE